MVHILDFVEEGHGQSGQAGFSLLLDKAFKWGQVPLIWGLYKLDYVEEGHVQSGQVGFPLLLNIEVGSRGMDAGFVPVRLFEKEHVQSGRVSFPLPLKSDEVWSRSMDLGFVQVGLCARRGMFRIGN